MPGYDLDSIKDQIDLVQFMIDHKFEVEYDRSGYTRFFNPNTQSSDNLTAYHASNLWKDYTDGTSGNVFQLCVKYMGMTMKEAIAYCAEQVSAKPVPYQKLKGNRKKPEKVFPKHHDITPVLNFNREINLAKPYLCGRRGLPEWILHQNMIGARQTNHSYQLLSGTQYNFKSRQVVLPDIAFTHSGWRTFGWQFRRDEAFAEYQMKKCYDQPLVQLALVTTDLKRKDPRCDDFSNRYDLSDARDKLFGLRYSGPRGISGAIFGFHHIQHLRKKNMHSIILCESAIDAMSWQALGYNAVRAPANPNIDYDKLFSNYAFRYVVKENDSGGEVYTKRMIALLNETDRININMAITLPEKYKDSNEAFIDGALSDIAESKKWGMKPEWHAKNSKIPPGACMTPYLEWKKQGR